MEEAAKAAPHLDGLGAAGRGFFARAGASGEDRLVMIFVGVSVVAHTIVLLLGPMHWLRDKPPLADEWTMDVNLINDLDLPPPTKTALPKAETAPEAKAPAELLPQLPKQFSVKEPTKAEDAAPVEKEKPKDVKPAAETVKAPEPVIKTENKEDNKLDQKEILKRAALDRLKNQDKTAKETQAPEKDQLAQIADLLEKNKQKNAGFASASSKGKINKWLAQLKHAVQANYSLPAAYNLKGANLKVGISVTMSEGGDLQDLQVKQSSNDPTFDELTMQAVKAAAPLPKPPKEQAGEPVILWFTPSDAK